MPKITNLTPQKRNPYRYNIFIDDEFSFGASEDVIVSQRLTIGRELTIDEVEKLQAVIEKDRVYQKVLNFLSFRPRSIREVEHYIQRQKPPVDGEFVQEIVIRLGKLGYLNDKMFARWWIEQRRLKGKRYGKQRILGELSQKGVDRSTVLEELEISEQTQPEEALARQALQKLIHRVRETDYWKRKNKLIQGLVRRGFSMEVARTVLAEIEKD